MQIFDLIFCDSKNNCLLTYLERQDRPRIPLYDPKLNTKLIPVIPFFQNFFNQKSVLRQWRFRFKQFCALLCYLIRFYTIPNTLIQYQANNAYLSLNHGNFTNPKHLKIYQAVLNYYKNMRPLSVHPSHYKKKLLFFPFNIIREKC